MTLFKISRLKSEVSRIFFRLVTSDLRLHLVLLVLVTVTIEGSRLQSVEAAKPLTGQSPVAGAESTLLKQYCITCHNQRMKTADLALDMLDISQVAANAETWEKVVRKIR